MYCKEFRKKFSLATNSGTLMCSHCAVSILHFSDLQYSQSKHFWENEGSISSEVGRILSIG